MRSYGSCDGVILRLFYDITSVIIFLSVSLSQVIALIVYKKLYTDSKILVGKLLSYICLQGVIYGTACVFRQLNVKINTNSCNDCKGKVPAL